jgi:N utilization substance protein B
MAKPSFRHEGREAAVKFLFATDLNQPGAGEENEPDLDEALRAFWKLHPAGPKARQFGEHLIRGAVENLPVLDEKITAYAQNYALTRLSAVDRNVLRVAIHEMLHREDIPPVVSINEAIDIARKFGTEGSGNFVNGILDQFKNELTRPLRTAAGE